MKLLVVTKKVDKNDQLLGFFVQWLCLLSEWFNRIEVLCLEEGEYDLPSNVSVHSLGKDRGMSKLKQLFNFYSLLSTLNYDAVLVHMNPIWMALGGIYWKVTSKKTFFWYTSGGVTFKLRIATMFSNTVFTASPESFRLKSDKIVVTGHGIDTELFKPDPDKLSAINYQLRLLSVGRISPVKNYETLVEAAKILKDKKVNFKVTMVGEPALVKDKDYESSLKSKIKSLDLEENFNFVGKISHNDLPEYYGSHDVFIHLSKTGSLDKAILEAMASGMKVLSSSDSARKFLSQELLFNESDSEELAEKIFRVKDLPVSDRLRNYVVQNHNLPVLIDKLTKLIKN